MKSVKVDCSKSTFEMFRSDSDDLFGLVEEKNLKSKISIFNLTDVLPMVNCYTTLSSDIIRTGPNITVPVRDWSVIQKLLGLDRDLIFL